MIDSKDLKIGNWLQGDPLSIPKLGMFSDGKLQITAYGIHCIDSDPQIAKKYNPIPFTVEILESFGFEIDRIHGNSGLYNVCRKHPLTYNSIHGWWIYNVQMEHQIEYLHEVQNLYKSTTGQELIYSPIK